MQMLKRPDNRALYLILTTLYTVGFMFCSGTILQTFMLSVGMDEGTVSAYSAMTQFVQFVVIFLMAFLADKLKKVLKVYAFSVLMMSLIAVSLVLCVFIRSDLAAVKMIIFASSAVVYFMFGVRQAVDYKIVYEIFDMSHLGKLMGVVMAVSGLVAFGVSTAYSYAITRFDYYDAMTVFFIISSVMMILAAVAGFSYKKINDVPEAEKRRGLDFSMFKNKISRSLALPSFVRGFANGVIGLITVAGFSRGILTTQSSTYVSIITQAMTFAGFILFAAMCRRVKNRATVLIFSIIMAVAMPIALISGRLADYLIFYAIAYFSLIVVSVAIPMLACEIVPYEQMGSFTCVRMMLFTLGSVIASVLFKPLSDLIGFSWLFVIAGVCQLICGVAHFAVARSAQRRPTENKTEE